jgi:hypothetical protein
VEGGHDQPVAFGAGKSELGRGLEIPRGGRFEIRGQADGGVTFGLAVEQAGERGPGMAKTTAIRVGDDLVQAGQAVPQVPEAVDCRDVGGPGGIGEEVGQGSRLGQLLADQHLPGHGTYPTPAVQLSLPRQRKRQQRTQQQAPNRRLDLPRTVGSGGGSDDIGDEANGGMVDQPRVGTVVGDTATIEGTRQLREQVPRRADQHCHVVEGDAVDHPQGLHLGRDPFRLRRPLVEQVGLHPATMSGRDDLGGCER